MADQDETLPSSLPQLSRSAHRRRRHGDAQELVEPRPAEQQADHGREGHAHVGERRLGAALELGGGLLRLWVAVVVVVVEGRNE